MINNREYAWEDLTISLSGRIVTGVQGVEYGCSHEKEAVYGKGNKPIAIQSGNKSYEGKVTLLQSEYEALRTASGGDITSIDTIITISYGDPTKGDVMVTDILTGVQFTEDKTSWSQGDKFQTKELSFIYLDQIKG